MFAGPDVFAQAAGGRRPSATFERGDRPLDPAAIMASVGEAPYEWSIDSDALAWGANAAAVLMVGEPGRDRERPQLRASCWRPDSPTSRFDAVMKSRAARRRRRRALSGAIRAAHRQAPTRSSGSRTSAAGSPARTASRRARTASSASSTSGTTQEERLAYLSRFDGLTGEMNRCHLTEVLEAALQQAIAQRTSCGFMLVAIDNLARINESYGFDVADEVIGAVAKRLRAKMRGGDQLGRFSGNKFGIILNNCTPEDMEKAAERLLAGVRDDVVRTGGGPGRGHRHHRRRHRAAPRRATVQEILARAQETLDRAKAKRPGSYQVYRPNIEREALRRENVRAADEIVNALNERRILLAFEPVVETATRKPAFYECLMRIRRADGTLAPAERGDPDRGAARVWCACSTIACSNCWSSEMAAVPDLQRQRQRLAGLHHRSGLVVDAWRAAARATRAWPSG